MWSNIGPDSVDVGRLVSLEMARHGSCRGFVSKPVAEVSSTLHADKKNDAKTIPSVCHVSNRLVYLICSLCVCVFFKFPCKSKTIPWFFPKDLFFNDLWTMVSLTRGLQEQSSQLVKRLAQDVCAKTQGLVRLILGSKTPRELKGCFLVTATWSQLKKTTTQTWHDANFVEKAAEKKQHSFQRPHDFWWIYSLKFDVV